MREIAVAVGFVRDNYYTTTTTAANTIHNSVGSYLNSHSHCYCHEPVTFNFNQNIQFQ